MLVNIAKFQNLLNWAQLNQNFCSLFIMYWLLMNLRLEYWQIIREVRYFPKNRN